MSCRSNGEGFRSIIEFAPNEERVLAGLEYIMTRPALMKKPGEDIERSFNMTNQEQSKVCTFANAPDVLTPMEAARLMRVGKNKAYELIKTGELPSVRSGRRILIPKTAVMRWLGIL